MVDPLSIYLKLTASSGQWLAALHALHAAKIVLNEPPALLNVVSSSSPPIAITNKKLIKTSIASEINENYKNVKEYQKIVPSENALKLTKCFNNSNVNTMTNTQNTVSTDEYSKRSQEDKLLSEESVLLLIQTMLDAHKWQLALQVARLPISCVTSSKNISVDGGGGGGVSSNSEMEEIWKKDRAIAMRSWSAYKLAIESVMKVTSATTPQTAITSTEATTSANKVERENVENTIPQKDILLNVAFMICEAARVCNFTSASQYAELLQLIEIMMEGKCNDSAMHESLQNTKTHIIREMETQSIKAKEQKESNVAKSEDKENETSKPREIYERSNTNYTSLSDFCNQNKTENVNSISKNNNNNNNVDKKETEAVKEKRQQQEMLRRQLYRLVKSSHSEIWKRALQLWWELTLPTNSDLQNVCVILTKARRERELTDLIRLYLIHIDNKNNHQHVEWTSVSITCNDQEKWKCVHLNNNLIKLFAESALQLRSRALAMLLLHSNCINSLLSPSSAVPMVEVLKQCREEKLVIEWWNKLLRPGLPEYYENNNKLYEDEFLSSEYDAKSKRSNISVAPVALREHIKLCSYVATCIALIARRTGVSGLSSSNASVWEEILLTFQYSAKYNPTLAVLFALRSLRITQSWEQAIWLYTAYLHKCANSSTTKKESVLQEVNRCWEEEEKWHETCEGVLLSDDISLDSSNVTNSNNKQKDKIWNIFFANCEWQINERTHREIRRIFHDENPTQWIPAKVLTRLYEQEKKLQKNEKTKY